MQHLLDLAPPIALAGQEEILHQLLRKRRSPLQHMTGRQVYPCRLDDTDQVDAVMLVEAMILGGEHRVDQRRRHFAQRHQAPLLPRPWNIAPSSSGSSSNE